MSQEVCPKCSGEGVVANSEGELVVCTCVILKRYRSYLKGFPTFQKVDLKAAGEITPFKPGSFYVEATTRNLLKLKKMLISYVYPCPYMVLPFHRSLTVYLNKDPKLGSIYEMASNYDVHIVTAHVAMPNKSYSYENAVAAYANAVIGQRKHFIIVGSSKPLAFARRYGNLAYNLASLGMMEFIEPGTGRLPKTYGPDSEQSAEEEDASVVRDPSKHRERSVPGINKEEKREHRDVY
jgi:hypothetical protein